jgi:hypothetical protein
MTYSDKDETVWVEGTIVRKTELAILFNDGKVEVWIPKSQVIDEDREESGLLKIEIPEWIALDKGLI